MLIDRTHPERGAVERLVCGIYAERYGADVRQFAPRLVALHEDGEIVAASGPARNRACRCR